MALEFKISPKLLKDLEIHFKNGKPKVALVLDEHNNETWSIIEQPTKVETPIPTKIHQSDS